MAHTLIHSIYNFFLWSFHSLFHIFGARISKQPVHITQFPKTTQTHFLVLLLLW